MCFGQTAFKIAFGGFENIHVSAGHGFDFLGGETAAFQADQVQAAQFAAVTGNDTERNDVAGNARHAADHGFAADAAELVNGAVAAQNGAVADADMAADDRVVGHDDVVADDAVMRNVAIDHEHAVVADGGGKVFFRRAALHGDVFADNVVFADDEFRFRLKFVAVILRTAAQDRARKDDGAVADGGVVHNRDMSDQLNVFADFCF